MKMIIILDTNAIKEIISRQLPELFTENITDTIVEFSVASITSNEFELVITTNINY